MCNLSETLVGTAWLAQHFGVSSIGRPPVMSRIGGRRTTQIEGEFYIETYPESMRPESSPAAHLQFHLRHELPHLEFLSHLFTQSGPEFIQHWVEREPTGQYARRAAFLYEWLMGEALKVPDRIGGNYIDVLDEKKLITASQDSTIKNRRWRVNDNLPGTQYFCPLIIKTESLIQANELNVSQLFDELTTEFGEDLLMRAAVWLTLRESKASFTIEGESDQLTRVQRFAEVMATRTGQDDVPLNEVQLTQLQREILGERTTLTHLGLRQSPVFVGEIVGYQEVVHYVAPPASDIAKMLHGLSTFLDKTKGQSSVMRCAVASFGFVYIHPLADGNGRVHRFLINDILRRDGAIPDPIILPISAAITEDASEQRAYYNVLDSVSKPLMQSVREQIEFAPTRRTYPDGVTSNFEFGGLDQARPLWRFTNFNPHIIYLANLLRRTVSEQMRDQSRYLRNHIQARLALKEIVEMPDHQADRLLRSIRQNQGQLSNVLAKEMPVLRQPGIWDDIISVVTQIFLDNS